MLGAFPFSIRINGVPLLPTIVNDIIEVVVDLKKDMPGMFTIRLQDNELIPTTFTYTDLPLPFVVGAMVSISATSVEEIALPVPTPLISGEITATETEFTGGGTFLTVRGYQKSHRLMRGKKTATYLMMPDNLIVSKICLSAGVPVTAMPTGAPNEYVLQSNQSDWDFIQERGKRLGYEFKTNALGITTFGPRGIPSGSPARMLLGSNLLSFRPRVNAHGQVSAVTVQGWDPKLKFPIMGMFVVPPTPIGGNSVRTAADLLGSKLFGATAKQTIVDRPLDNMAVAMLHATAAAKNIISDFVQADGECQGNPLVLPGSPILIIGCGIKYSGTYVVSSTTHIFNTATGYTTQFFISGTQPETVLGMMDGEGQSQKRATGVVIGVVTNNMDPLQMGRVKVRFPHLGSIPPVESNWCRLATGSGGMLSGTYFIPDINTEVLVAFEHGDVNFPYIIGTLWNNLDRPPKPTAAVVIGGKVVERIITTAKGHTISLNDMPGKEAITLSDKLGLNSIMLDLTKKSIVLKSMNEVSIDCTIFKVNAKAKIDMTAMADFSIKSNAMLKMESTIVKIKASGMLGLEGTSAELKGVGNLALKGGAGSIMLAGPLVSINNGALDIM